MNFLLPGSIPSSTTVVKSYTWETVLCFLALFPATISHSTSPLKIPWSKGNKVYEIIQEERSIINIVLMDLLLAEL